MTAEADRAKEALRALDPRSLASGVTLGVPPVASRSAALDDGWLDTQRLRHVAYLRARAVAMGRATEDQAARLDATALRDLLR